MKNSSRINILFNGSERQKALVNETVFNSIIFILSSKIVKYNKILEFSVWVSTGYSLAIYRIWSHIYKRFRYTKRNLLKDSRITKNKLP